MGVYSTAELKSALYKAGCRETKNTTGTSTIWLTQEGKAFQVPFPYKGFYPTWMLMEVCEAAKISPIPWEKGAL